MCLISIVSAIETVGDISGIAKGGAGREATDKELAGGTYADGIGSAIAGVFGGLPNTSFSQNVGLISMTGVMSRSVVTLSALFLIACGLIPKVGAVVAAMPISVLGGGVILMFGMVLSAGVSMLSSVNWSRRNMMIWQHPCQLVSASSRCQNQCSICLTGWKCWPYPACCRCRSGGRSLTWFCQRMLTGNPA